MCVCVRVLWPANGKFGPNASACVSGSLARKLAQLPAAHLHAPELAVDWDRVGTERVQLGWRLVGLKLCCRWSKRIKARAARRRVRVRRPPAPGGARAQAQKAAAPRRDEKFFPFNSREQRGTSWIVLAFCAGDPPQYWLEVHRMNYYLDPNPRPCECISMAARVCISDRNEFKSTIGPGRRKPIARSSLPTSASQLQPAAGAGGSLQLECAARRLWPASATHRGQLSLARAAAHLSAARCAWPAPDTTRP